MMKITYKKSVGYLDFSGTDCSVALEKTFCAAEWLEHDGVVRRFESLGMPETSMSETGNRIVVNYAQEKSPSLTWSATMEKAGVLLKIAIKNTTSDVIRLKKLVPFALNFKRAGTFDPGCPITQTYWFDQGELSPTYLWDALYSTSTFKGSGMCCLYNIKNMNGMTLGFVTMQDLQARMILDFDEKKPESFLAECLCEGIPLAPGKTFVSEKLMLGLNADVRDGINIYTARTAREMKTRRDHKAPSGWSTWDYYFADISEESILDNIKFLREHKADFPLEYIQIDSGYADPWGQWKVWDRKKFPHGPEWLVKKIRGNGFKAALWTVPFFVLPESEEAVKHPDWLVRDEFGELLRIGKMLVLDGSHPEASEWLKKLAELITKKWGFEYVKLDGATLAGLTSGTRYNKSLTGYQAYFQGIKAFREGMAPGSLLLASAFAPYIGLTDAGRLSHDVGARWDWSKIDVHHGERDRYHGSGYVLRQINACFNGAYMNGKFWINDGDYLVVRDDRSELTVNEARVWATAMGLYGGSVILGDQMTTLTTERAKIAAAVLPAYDSSAVPVDFLKSKIPEILTMDVKNCSEQWKLAAVFNYSDKPVARTIALDTLGMDTRSAYHAFEFWNSAYLGSVNSTLAVALEPHSCKVFALRRDTGVPQVVGTDIHITQGGVETEKTSWKKPGKLEISMKAQGEKSGRLFVAVPEKFLLKKVLPAGISVEQSGKGMLCLNVKYFKKTKIALSFA